SVARPADPDHGLGHSLVVLDPESVSDRSPRATRTLEGPPGPARHRTALLVRDLRGPTDRHPHRPGPALLSRLLRPLPPAPGDRLGAAARAGGLRRLQRGAASVPKPGRAFRTAATAARGAGRVPAPRDEGAGLRDRDVPGHRHPKGHSVRVR